MFSLLNDFGSAILALEKKTKEKCQRRSPPSKFFGTKWR